MRWETEAAGTRSLRTCAQHLVALILIGIAGLAQAQSPSPCTPALGRIVSLQGTIELLRHGSGLWERLTRLDIAVCRGDRLRAGLLSRAAMYINPETIVRLDQNTTLELVEQTDSETILRFHQDDLTHALASQSNFCGVGYFITRFPRKLRVRTPFYNAVVEGTEFQVAMTCDRGELAVFEGKVAAESVTASNERVLLESGQSTSVGVGETPSAIKTIVKPSDAVQWALYYLPLTDVSLLDADALAQDCALLSPELRSACTIRRAEYLLRVGRAEEARAQLSGLLLTEPNNGDVLALESIVAVVQNDKAAALDFAQRAVAAAPNSFRPYAALSYAQQANFKLEEALEAARRAAELAPDSALLRARTAEIQLSLGRVRSAEREAIEAVRLNPNESRAHLILGFVHLAQIDTKKATEDFTRAIELDSTEPLARLGLGLATIREGRLQEGREQIEIAVALDPTNSLVRSYVGKAYYEENTKARDQLAATQFGLAKALDPNDPTPWFYDAILKQTQNRPVEALEDLEKSIALNQNRGVTRSETLLAKDSAARGSLRARLYNRLGFRELGMQTAAEALSSDFGSPDAHRFVADMAATIPRREIARGSELLQSQLRQELGSLPLQAQLANDALIQDSFAGPLAVGTPDLSQLFQRDELGVQAFGLYGEPHTWGEQLVVGGLAGQVSFSLSQLARYDEGYRENNEDRQQQYDGLVQTRLSYSTSLQLSASSARRRSGDLQSYFHQDAALTTLTDESESENYRVGLRHRFNAESDVLLYLTYANLEESGFNEDAVAPFTVSVEQRSRKAEAQYLLQHALGSLAVGGYYFAARGSVSLSFPTFFFESEHNANARHSNAYFYFTSRSPPKVPQLTVGLAYDDLHSPVDVGDRDALSPKLGLWWKPMPSLTIRAASFRTLKRRSVGDQGLEPTMLAGFNQFFDDPNGTLSATSAVAFDIHGSRRLFAGLQYFRRKLESPVLLLDEVITQNRKDKYISGYLYALPFRNVSVSFEPKYQRYENGEVFDDMTLWEVPLYVRYFLPHGWGVGVSLTGVKQSGTFDSSGGAPLEGSDRFSVLSAIVTYSLPKRRGYISLEATNLLNTDFQYQEVAAEVAPRYLPVRRVLLRAALEF